MFPARVHRRIFLVLLALLGGSMVTSVWVANLAWVLLGANWLLEGRWREKWQMARTSRLLHAMTALYALLLVAMLWTSNLAHGLAVLQIKMPLLFLPLVLLTTRPVEAAARRNILALYAATVLVVSAIGAWRMLSFPDLPYRDAVPFVSHIRFSLNCCMVVCLCAVGMAHSRSRLRWLLLLPVGWLLLFLLMLRSYTAVVVLAVVPVAVVVLRRRRWWLVALWGAAVLAVALPVAHEARAFYRLGPLSIEPLRPLTAGGRPYEHARGGLIECGNYVGNYVCREELRTEWECRSALPYDSLTLTGYRVEPTLVRYLNALGLTKDSVGVHALSPEQVAAVERGVANPVYESRNPLRKMVCVMLLEHEYHHRTESVSGFSMLQRFDLWGATLGVVGRHPWFGVGTGDVDDALHAELARRHSSLAGTGIRSHNQYLSLLAAVGSIGLLLLVLLLLRAAPALRRQPALLLAWTLTILISCLTEDTLDTLAGILFCTWCMAFRSPAGQKSEK